MLAVYFLLLITALQLKAQPYVPFLAHLGDLPEFPDQGTTYDLKSNGQVPPDAKEVFIYVFVTTRGEGNFQRGYYKLFTSKAEKQFKQFMNVATGQGVMAVNSANLWFPMGDGKLNVTLKHDSNDKKRSIAGKTTQQHTEWSGVFVIGYR